jgi:carbonic anhydrase
MPKNVVKDLLVNNEDYTIQSDVLNAIQKGQSPKVTMITCSDSRVSGHIFSNDLVNHVFHIRNIGNQIENNYGSVDYGIHHLKTPILLVLGHTDCGAIKASQKDFTAESDEIRKELYPLHFRLAMSSKLLGKEDPLIVSRLVQANVDTQVKEARKRYGEGQNVVGAIFDIHGHMSSKPGRVVITNINGITEVDRLRSHELVSEVKEEIRNLKVGRI